MKKYPKFLFAVVFIFVSLRGVAVASMVSPLTGVWKSLDPYVGGFTITITERPYDSVHGEITFPGSAPIDLGVTPVRDVQSPFKVQCGILRDRIAVFKVKKPNMPDADFELKRVRCPDGTDYDSTHSITLYYDTIYSSIGAKTKDVMSAYTLTQIHD